MRKVCGEKNVKDFTPEFCSGFKLYSNTTFFPIRRDDWDSYFKHDKEVINKTMNAIQNSIAVFLGNSSSTNQKFDKSEKNNAFEILAKINCPKVYLASN